MVIRHAADEHRLNELRCKFVYSAPARVFNALPMHVQTSDNITIFKKRLKTQLFTECYDLEDMLITEVYSL